MVAMSDAARRQQTIENIFDSIAEKVEVVEEPGTGLPVAQCPYCSNGYLAYDAEQDEPIQTPTKCRRCGAPMDWDAVHNQGGYADKQADEALKAPPRRGRDRMVRQSTRKGMTRKDLAEE